MGRNEEANQLVKDERREQILSAAVHLFATRGLFATKIADIAAAAGISQGLTYHYFGSKEEIFTVLIRGAFEKMNAACRMLEEMPLAPQDKVRLALERLLEGLAKHADTAPNYLLIAQATASDAVPNEAKAVIRKENQKPYDVMTRIFAEGQRAGVFRPDPPAVQSLLFWTTIKGLAIHKATHGKRFTPPDPEILMRMFLM